VSEKVLMRGSHVIGEAAVRAGCRFYAGYPITPQNELTEYMAAAMARYQDKVFIQAESELAAINMVIGAAMAGARAMTSSSSPGVSLKQEGISYLAGQELPAVIVNLMRGGPGLGNIAPTQGDYFQATRGGGHGDYRTIVLAPASGQEIADLTIKAFEYADHYRTPVMLLGDGMMGQMMEPVVLPPPIDVSLLPQKPYILDGAKGRPARLIKSLYLDPAIMEEHNWKLYRKYQQIAREITQWEEFMVEDARLIVVAYGTCARIAKGAIRRLREMDIKVGMLRPITLFPFPSKVLRELSLKAKDFLVLELSTGQMLEDVRLAIEGRARTHFYGRPGGVVPTPDEVAKHINLLYHRQELNGGENE